MNKETKTPESVDELERVLELTDMDLDYSEMRPFLEDLTRLAARIAGTSVSLVNLIDSYTQWTVASTGLDLEQMEREDSVCQYTIQEADEFEVKDLKKDERFARKFYVEEGPFLRYYYGVPLETSEGINVGALCVMDQEEKKLDPENKEMLKLIADEIVKRLKFIKAHKNLREQLDDLKDTHRKVSHDIRGPIGGIIGLADIIQQEAKEKDLKDIMELISLIKKGGESVLELADEIMSQRSGQEQPGEDEFSCGTFCEKLRKLYNPQAKNKGVDLTIRTSSESDSIFFSKAKLVQITGNLISNSIKFTSKGGKVEVVVQVEEVKEKTENLLRIFVEDSGVGMSDEKVGQILKGASESSQGTSGESGYGFGLKLVSHLVHKADGDIHVVSTPGEGTKFEVVIPV